MIEIPPPSALPLKRHEAAIIKGLRGREAAPEAMLNTAYRLSVTKSANQPGPAELTTTIFSHTGICCSCDDDKGCETPALETYQPEMKRGHLVLTLPPLPAALPRH